MPENNSPAKPALPLSARQVECLARIAAGETSSQIADALKLSPRTVDHYVAAACARLGVKTRAHAVAMALQLHLLPDAAGSRRAGP
ncbi:MAG: hypothetical protein BGN86_07825 [Caulobacterales bacterium 68-7]|nr:helix-turn-helix transcriptional regulator [Caulobacterales bacterium]OJU08741.1 MAG: hypothetical protein BGN86_07825 [Caulobacterales bacterium 68-7]